MNHAFRIFSLLLIISTFVMLDRTAIADDDLATQVDIAYEKFTLDNGLTVLVHSDHSTPTVFVGMWYGVGSKDEPEGKTGFAHLFEHLMFQGTENREGEFFSPFTDAGATGMNGTTNSDRTNYFATVPTGALDMALWMESDRMANLLGAVTQEALDEQRGVVQNEKRQRANRPYSGMFDKVAEGLHPVGHPYRHSVIGSMEDLNAASVEDVHEWFNTYYGASNVILVLAGDVSIEDAKEKVAHYFNEAPAGVPLSHPKQWIPELKENRLETMYDKVGNIRISRVWALPGLNDKATALMYLVNESLVGNKNSPLKRKLVDELKLATYVGGGAFGRIMSGQYGLTIDLRPGVTPEEVLSVVDETIAEYLVSGPDQQIVDNAILSTNMYMLGALETGSAVGRRLAEGQLFSDNPLFVNQELAWVNNTNAKELKAIANEWLTRGYYQLTVLPFPEYTTSEATADRTSLPEVTTSSTINFPKIETASLDNGMKLVVATRGSIPLVDISIQIDTGITADSTVTPGTSAFLFALMQKGTKKYDANELAAAKDKIGMGGAPRADTERSSFGYRILRANMDSSLELAAEILSNPTFPAEELEKERTRMSAMLANREQSPAGAASGLFDQAIYGIDSPMGKVWKPEVVESVNREELVALHRAEVTPDNMTVFMIGDIGIDEATKSVNKAFGKWDAKGRSEKQLIGAAAEKRARVILVDYPGAESSVVYGGHAIAPYDATTWTEITTMNRVIGGSFESRLNMNLREDKGWSYGFRSGITPNASGDMRFVASGQVQTDKTAPSMQEARRELEEFVSDRPATENEVDRIKLNRTRSLPGTYSTNRGFLGSIISSDSYGLPFDYAESQADRIAAVTLEGINTRARSLIDTENLTWLIVGDLAIIEEDVRALNFGDVEVWDAFGNKIR